jgi:hypothetical protein
MRQAMLGLVLRSCPETRPNHGLARWENGRSAMNQGLPSFSPSQKGADFANFEGFRI